jgi:hypothetical protein
VWSAAALVVGGAVAGAVYLQPSEPDSRAAERVDGTLSVDLSGL